MCVVALVLVGVILMFIPSGSNKEKSEQTTLTDYKISAEAELAELCSSIDGVGKCRVSVSFSEGESFRYSGSKLISSAPPRVFGVTVVCEGGDDDRVKERISDCMTSLFDIGANRVCVLKLK